MIDVMSEEAISLRLSGVFARKTLGKPRVLTEVLRRSGLHRRVLRFNSRSQMLQYLVKLFTPYASEITQYERRLITLWLRWYVFLSDDEIELFYKEVLKNGS